MKDIRNLIILSISIDAFDGAEFCGKWPQGGKSRRKVTPQDWMKEVPLVNYKYDYTYRGRTRELRNTLKEMGVTKG